MALKFGTSGVRGLVTEMTDRECYLYTCAYLQYLKTREAPATIALAGDHRKSTPRILQAVAFTAQEQGFAVDYCGLIPTPAVTAYGLKRGMAGIMVTGSHVPDDRNGIKYNMPWGEVLKTDEAEISRRYAEIKKEKDSALDQDRSAFNNKEELNPDLSPVLNADTGLARKEYIQRYISFFPASCLQGLKIVVYQHSTVAREILPEILSQLGAEVIPVGWSDAFIPVDTEAVENTEQLAKWVDEYKADALVTADGDGDRPLMVDERGKVVRGDVLGILVASFLQADAVCLPVSCNTALEGLGRFEEIVRTRIGSPYVIEAMNMAVQAGRKTVVGYEANGGFLTASDMVQTDTGQVLPALPTRDAALPIISLLSMACKQKKSLSQLVGGLPPRFTQSGLLRQFPNELGKQLVESFQIGGKAVAERIFQEAFGSVEALDFTDGARIFFSSGDIVHLRPSGNAPEFRCYSESSTEEQATRNNEKALKIIDENRDSLV